MIEKMPEQYKGKSNAKTEYVATVPREWTKEEIGWLFRCLEQGLTAQEIAYSMDRSLISVKTKIQKLRKKNNTYNEKYVDEKYKANEAFLEVLKPNSVLDLYTGEKNYYKDYDAETNDINERIPADHHMDALKCICMLYSQGKKYDLVDLDPFGSAYDCFDLAIKMAQKGLIVTLGEMGGHRWRRLDYVKRCYGIETFEDFTIDNLIKHIQKIGARNKKNLRVFTVMKWTNIGRVYFWIEPERKADPQVKDHSKEDRKMKLFDL